MTTRKARMAFGGMGAAIVVFLAWAVYTPIPFSLLKIAAIAGLALLFLGVGLGFKYGKWVCLLASCFLLAVALWPSRAPQTSRLRASYRKALIAYSGTPYVWGGENGRGVDCSGLMRRAMIDALMSQGWHDGNPSLWREAALVWWQDCSAAMKDGYSGRIAPLLASRSLNTLNTTDLQDGDMAILQSGVHVLAFIGGKTWIQADPNLANGGDKVIQTKAPSKNGWFGQRVVICRWKILS